MKITMEKKSNNHHIKNLSKSSNLEKKIIESNESPSKNDENLNFLNQNLSNEKNKNEEYKKIDN